MSIGIIGRKIGMTRVYDEAGSMVPVTVVEVAANRVTQVKNADSDGYRAVQVTTGEQRGDLVVISEGLNGGEQVVQAGVSKLRNNIPVTITEQARLKEMAEGAINEGVE